MEPSAHSAYGPTSRQIKRKRFSFGWDGMLVVPSATTQRAATKFIHAPRRLSIQASTSGSDRANVQPNARKIPDDENSRQSLWAPEAITTNAVGISASAPIHISVFRTGVSLFGRSAVR